MQKLPYHAEMNEYHTKVKQLADKISSKVIGIDLGTSAVKLLLMSGDGVIHKIVSKEYNCNHNGI